MRRYAYLVTCFMSLATPACAAWTIVVLPDTQNYVNAPANVPVFEAQTQWIVDNKDALAIQIVLHEGDITDRNTPDEWATAKKAMRTLDGQVPYTMVLGNHDFDPAPFDRSTNLLNDYFALADNPLNSITTEKIAGDLANTYSRFMAPDGRKILVFSLEYVPQPEVLAWAGGICEQFSDHTAIVLVHANVQEGPAVNGEPTTNRHAFGNDLWKILTSQHKNVEMVLNGHHPDGDDTDPHGLLTTARQSSPGKNGNVIHEMAFNSQQQPNGGNGYLRLLEFMDDGTTVQVRTYSPTLDRWLTSDRNEFQLKLTPLFPADANKTK